MKGRTIHVPRAAMGVARFSFHDLCEQPLAAADYLRIAHEYHTIILDHIPVMTFDNRNAAKRFIILIDTLYDMNVKLIASAAAEPDALYRADEGYEAQEFRRTASRLIEMRSQEYLARPHGAGAFATVWFVERHCRDLIGRAVRRSPCRQSRPRSQNDRQLSSWTPARDSAAGNSTSLKLAARLQAAPQTEPEKSAGSNQFRSGARLDAVGGLNAPAERVKDRDGSGRLRA